MIAAISEIKEICYDKRGLLNYLIKIDVERYRVLIEKLGLRK